MKNRFNTNLLIDLLLLLNMAAVSISGFVINYVMPPCIAHRHGIDGLVRYNRLTRHFWGDVHTLLGVTLLILLVLHIVLHRAALSAFFCRHIPSTPLRMAVYAVLAVVLAASVIPWVFAHYLFL